MKARCVLTRLCLMTGASLLACLDARPSWAGTTCVSGTSVRVCASWSQALPPVPGQDFVVTYSGTGVPTIELRTGDLAWEVYAEVIATGAPADIAALTIDPSSSSENFVVALTNNGEPGAANVGSVNLSAAG